MTTPYNIRLKIPYQTFLANPAFTIKQYLGQHITIISYTTSDIITSDDCIIVDIEYTSIQLSPFITYYIKTSSIKPIIPNSDKYIASINNCNVKITIPNISDYQSIPNSLIPINIRATLPNNYSPNGPIESQFTYFGTIVSSPMNNLCTPLRYINHSYEPFSVEPIKALYPQDYITQHESQHKDSFETDLLFTVKQYKQALVLFNILAPIDRVVSVNKFSECISGTTGYVINFSEIPLTEYINGIILIQSKRIPNYILFYPTDTCTISPEELLSIKQFLENDIVNYYNYEYVMNVINKSSK